MAQPLLLGGLLTNLKPSGSDPSSRPFASHVKSSPSEMRGRVASRRIRSDFLPRRQDGEAAGCRLPAAKARNKTRRIFSYLPDERGHPSKGLSGTPEFPHQPQPPGQVLRVPRQSPHEPHLIDPSKFVKRFKDRERKNRVEGI